MAIETVNRAFSDKRAFIVPEERSDGVFVTQAEDGPTYIRVGMNCTDGFLQRVWEGRTRFLCITLEQLLRVRNGESKLEELAA